MPVVFGLAQWSNRHHPAQRELKLSHDGCGQPVEIVAECGDGHRLALNDLKVSV
jgi:hypothetical protein